MPPDPHWVYWDACVFLSYINGVEDRLPIIDALLAEGADRDHERVIVTSTFSIVEVAYGVDAQGTLDAEASAKIDALWQDREAVKLIEFHEGIAREARTLIRGAVASGRSLKPGDAIHLATARRRGVAEFHTYSKDLPRWSELTGLKIVEPWLEKVPLF
jgi:predicted nucleic acid-binding protein